MRHVKRHADVRLAHRLVRVVAGAAGAADEEHRHRRDRRQHDRVVPRAARQREDRAAGHLRGGRAELVGQRGIARDGVRGLQLVVVATLRRGPRRSPRPRARRAPTASQRRVSTAWRTSSVTVTLAGSTFGEPGSASMYPTVARNPGIARRRALDGAELRRGGQRVPAAPSASCPHERPRPEDEARAGLPRDRGHDRHRQPGVLEHRALLDVDLHVAHESVEAGPPRPRRGPRAAVRPSPVGALPVRPVQSTPTTPGCRGSGLVARTLLVGEGHDLQRERQRAALRPPRRAIDDAERAVVAAGVAHGVQVGAQQQGAAGPRAAADQVADRVTRVSSPRLHPPAQRAPRRGQRCATRAAA